MEKNKPIFIVALAVIACAGIVGAYILIGPGTKDPGINASHAIEIVMNDPDAAAYYSSNFEVEDWRVTSTSLIENAPDYTALEGRVWKVEIMERSCACSTIKDLYVIEGYVSASNGELLEVSTKSVLESEYDKKTCSSTSCH
ncbi:hypothetical protein [Methanolobus sp. ZRKC5]|uniref:hypothetical protein n=1 Tax=unclassified Methanolobus TaxID=2629569 RepID=UPI00313A931C